MSSDTKIISAYGPDADRFKVWAKLRGLSMPKAFRELIALIDAPQVLAPGDRAVELSMTDYGPVVTITEPVTEPVPVSEVIETISPGLTRNEDGVFIYDPVQAEPTVPSPNPDEDDPPPAIELQPPPVLAIAGDGERDQDPIATGCPACDRGGVPRKGAPHVCGRPNPPGLGDRARWA